MSVHFITGKPGNGKSLYAMRLVAYELANGIRGVVTNLAINPGKLNEYLQNEYPHVVVDLHTRLRILSDDELGVFFLKRRNLAGVDVDIPPVTKEQEAKGLRPDFKMAHDDGIFYVLDEIHEKFNARAWMETGRSALYYLSQHRKLGDDVICITQALSNVDKQFRSVAQDFTTITNLGKKKVSLFRMPPIFMRKTYAEAPVGPNVAAMETGTFTLDVTGLASCYDTARGVGIQGKAADTKVKPRGISLMWAIAAAVALIFVCFFLPKMMASRYMKNGLGLDKTRQLQNPMARTNQPGVLVQAQLEAQRKLQSVTSNPPPTAPEPAFRDSDVKCTGWILNINTKMMEFWLSDGRTLKESRGDIQFANEEFIVSRGYVYYRAQPNMGAVASRPANAAPKLTQTPRPF